MATKEIGTSTPLVLVVALKVNDTGYFNKEMKLFQVQDFFSRMDFTGAESYYLTCVDNEPAVKLTKEFMIKKFPFFEDTAQFKHILDGVFSL